MIRKVEPEARYRSPHDRLGLSVAHRPVSYTHLDVYKRQALCRASSICCVTSTRRCICAAVPTVMRTQFSIRGSVKSVSYTHLDVYKRQGLAFPILIQTEEMAHLAEDMAGQLRYGTVGVVGGVLKGDCNDLLVHFPLILHGDDADGIAPVSYTHL